MAASKGSASCRSEPRLRFSGASAGRTDARGVVCGAALNAEATSSRMKTHLRPSLCAGINPRRAYSSTVDVGRWRSSATSRPSSTSSRVSCGSGVGMRRRIVDQTSQMKVFTSPGRPAAWQDTGMANVSPEDRAQRAFRDAQEEWRRALESHRLAPPDAGFSARLADLASAAAAEAAACREADAAGFEWPPHRASANKPPYELQPGTGRRGPDELWRVFDAAVAELNRAATGPDLIEVATALRRACRGSRGARFGG
jgi:hypothetical protein